MFTTLTDSSNIRDWSSHRPSNGSIDLFLKWDLSSTSCVLPPSSIYTHDDLIWWHSNSNRFNEIMEWRSTQEVDSTESKRQAEWERFYFIFFCVFCEVFQSLHWSLLLEQSEDTIITTILLQWLCSACLSLERAISCAQLSCQIAVFGPVVVVWYVCVWHGHECLVYSKCQCSSDWKLYVDDLLIPSDARELWSIDVWTSSLKRFEDREKIPQPLETHLTVSTSHRILSIYSFHKLPEKKKSLHRNISAHCVPEIYNNSTLEISLVIFWTSALCSRRNVAAHHLITEPIPFIGPSNYLSGSTKSVRSGAQRRTTHCTWGHLKAMVCFFDSIY